MGDVQDNGAWLVRPAEVTDLDAVNAIVEACVMGWNLPERVKRLSLASYRYQEHDLEHLKLVLAESPAGEVAGVAAWEPAEPGDCPQGKTALLLHGLYVAPDSQGRGIGALLIREALAAAKAAELDGLLVKAQADAAGYFRSRGFVSLPVIDPNRDYPHRYWMSIGQGAAYTDM